MILFLLAFVAFLIIGIPISVSIGFSAVLGYNFIFVFIFNSFLVH